MYELSLDFPNLARDEEVQITGIPQTLLNGHTYSITSEQADYYRDSQPVVLDEGGYGRGPALIDAFADDPRVTVIQKEGDE